MNKLTHEQKCLKDTYLHSGNLRFTIEYGKTRNKLVAVSTKEGESFRAFAYFTTTTDEAKTAILMEYRSRAWSK